MSEGSRPPLYSVGSEALPDYLRRFSTLSANLIQAFHVRGFSGQRLMTLAFESLQNLIETQQEMIEIQELVQSGQWENFSYFLFFSSSFFLSVFFFDLLLSFSY